MTKAWEAVRDETCRLYGEGCSLEYIRKHLLREQHFEASTRAFRLKLKAWKAKRSDSACSSCGSLPHDERARCDSGVSLSGSRGVLVPAIERTSDTAPTVAVKSLGRTYEELLQTQKLGDQPKQELIVRSCTFSDTSTSILHHAAKEPHRVGRNTVLLAVLAHMQRLGISTDIKDELGQTALEIAIRTNQAILVGMLLEHDASTGEPNAEGDLPLHLALSTGASATIHGHLLRHGADPNINMVRCRHPSTPISFAVDRLAQESVQAPRAIDGSCFKWFQIISKFVEHGASFDTADLTTIIRLFNRYWRLSQASEELLDCARPVLRAYFRSGLDPTLPVSASEKDSLAHSAFHHAQNNSLATLVIEEADPQKHGPALVRYLLTSSNCAECPYPTPELNEALRMLLEELSRACVLLDFDPLIECLTRTPAEQKVAFAQTIQELQPAHRRRLTFQRRDDFVTAIAALPRRTRFDVAEILLRRESPIERCDGMADVMRSVQTSLTSTFASVPEMIEVSACGFLGFCDCSKVAKQDFIQCVIHVATKEAIQRLTEATVRQQLGRLVALREWYRLPSIDIPQKLLMEALGSKIRGGTRSPIPVTKNEQSQELSDSIQGWCYVGFES